MLAILKLTKSDQLAYFEFGHPLEPTRDAEAHLRWVLADYDRRRDEQWSVPPPEGAAILDRPLSEAGDEPARLLPIIRALGWYGIPESSPDLWKYLLHPRDEIKLATIKSLGQQGLYDSIGRLWPLLDHPQREFRHAAFIALGKFGRREVILKLEEVAGRDPELRFPLAQARARIEAAAAEDWARLVEVVIGTNEYEDLVALMIFVWQPTAAILTDGRRPEVVRRRAARLLGLGRARRSMRSLLSVATSPTEPLALRVEAVIALGRLRTPKAVDDLIPLVRSREPSLQEAAIVALGQIGEPRALGTLLEHWDDRGGALRESLRLAARRLCSISGLELLTDLLRRRTPIQAGAVYIIDDRLNLHRAYRSGLVDAQLNHSQLETRRDALLLLGVYGGRSDADNVEKLLRRETDESMRELAQLILDRLRLLPR
jgi:HEAT repeat protein